MNTSLTEIAFILDRSGSMETEIEAAITSFNTFLHDQRETPGEARFTLVLFDDRYEVPCSSIPISEVTDLDATTFVPRGNTALLDAIGRTINELGARLAAMPEADRPGQVIVAILTDGFENASRKFTHDQIADLIAHQRDIYKWQFFFLGANQDAIATAAAMNIAANCSLEFVHSAAGFHSSSRALSRKVSALRSLKAKMHMSPEEITHLKSSLSEIAEQEDPERGK